MFSRSLLSYKEKKQKTCGVTLTYSVDTVADLEPNCYHFLNLQSLGKWRANTANICRVHIGCKVVIML